jgi:hypothetical protein
LIEAIGVLGYEIDQVVAIEHELTTFGLVGSYRAFPPEPEKGGFAQIEDGGRFGEPEERGSVGG